MPPDFPASAYRDRFLPTGQQVFGFQSRLPLINALRSKSAPTLPVIGINRGDSAFIVSMEASVAGLCGDPFRALTDFDGLFSIRAILLLDAPQNASVWLSAQSVRLKLLTNLANVGNGRFLACFMAISITRPFLRDCC